MIDEKVATRVSLLAGFSKMAMGRKATARVASTKTTKQLARPVHSRGDPGGRLAATPMLHSFDL
ncbi:MAG: hypothetical protein ACRDIV_02075 [Ktedonobacteraceae bacterium]